jgi:hypothetical protein
MNRRIVHLLLLLWLLSAQSLGAVHRFSHVVPVPQQDVAKSEFLLGQVQHQFDESLCPWLDDLLGGPAMFSFMAALLFAAGARKSAIVQTRFARLTRYRGRFVARGPPIYFQ